MTDKKNKNKKYTPAVRREAKTLAGSSGCCSYGYADDHSSTRIIDYSKL